MFMAISPWPWTILITVAASMPLRDAARDPALAAVHSFDLVWEEKSGTSRDRGDPAGYRVGYGLIAMFCVSFLAGTIGMWNSSQSFVVQP
jgi:hypothetical protein